MKRVGWTIVAIGVALAAASAVFAATLPGVREDRPPSSPPEPGLAQPDRPGPDVGRPEVPSSVTSVPSSTTLGSDGLLVGVTHSELSPLWDPDACCGGQPSILASAPVQAVHIMGYGLPNPQPSPGEWNLEFFDDRLERVIESGAEPVVVLCCAPDWMKGGEMGETDWSRLEAAPSSSSNADFAVLAAEIASRHPEVTYFLVWNELKGFFDTESNSWDAAGYTELFNDVSTAIREVRPDALIGGPYVVIDSWARPSHPSELRGSWGVADRRALDALDYWLANAIEPDFVVVDGSAYTRDSGYLVDPLESAQFFGDVTRWVRARTDLPLWWAEWYVVPPDSDWSGATKADVGLAAMQAMADAGASVALSWQPGSTPLTGGQGAYACPGPFADRLFEWDVTLESWQWPSSDVAEGADGQREATTFGC